jgi:hypothetical protein
VVRVGPEHTPHPRPRWLIRLTSNLNRWQRPLAGPRNLDPAVAAQELLAWTQDDGRWNPRAQRDWQSLLDDVDASWSRLGPLLAQAADVDDYLVALRSVRAAPIISAADHRSTVDRAARALETAFDDPEALIAAFDDLFAAAQQNSHPDSLDDETRWRLALLASVGVRNGHDWGVIAERVQRALQWTTGKPVAESADAVHRALRTPPGDGHSIVWLAVDHAWSWGASPNPSVQLINGDWLLAVLRDWDGPREGVPDELAADPQTLVNACSRFDDSATPEEQLPVTFARIDLGTGPTAGVRERARDTLELLISRASALQGGTNWKISGVCLHFVDGELIFTTSGPIGDPGIYDRLTRTDILNDPTGATINKEAKRLRAHLPVTDGRLHEALQLSEWLAQARRSSPPARLVLSGRILEQTANWAGVPVPTLVDDYLALPWAWDRIAADLSRAGTTAVLRLRGSDGTSSSQDERQTFLDISGELFDKGDDRGRPRARPWDVLHRLDWLIEQHHADTEIGDYLRELRQRLADGPAAAAWIDDLCDELKTRNARAVRTRNVVVHGGPMVTAVAKTVVGIQDALGKQALDWVIDGLAAGKTLPDVFAEHRTRYIDALGRLRANGDPNAGLTAVSG